jgi:hypothetical protein
MKRMIVRVTAGLLLLAATGAAYGQIKVVKKPAPRVGPDEEVVYDNWTSSWGCRDDAPEEYPLGTATHKTEAAAVAAAKAHIARTAGNGALAVTHYLIEGEPSVRKKSAERVKRGMELLTRLKEAKEAVDQAKKVEKGEACVLKAKERKLGDTIKEYKDMVAKSFRQAVEAKKTLTRGVGTLTEAKFRQVNGLIDKYNREIKDFQSVMGSDADLGFSPLARVEGTQLAGTECIGTARINRTGKEVAWRVSFDADNTCRVEGNRGGSSATWKQSGQTVWIRSADASNVLELKIEGNIMIGEFVSNDGSTRITIRVQRKDN